MSKKVIEQEIEPDLNIELLPDGTIYVKPMFPYTDVYIEESVRTTVAKAICPEYQKVIDQNAKLVEALEGLLEGVEVFCKTIPAKMTSEAIHLWTKRRDGIEALQNTKNIEG